MMEEQKFFDGSNLEKKLSDNEGNSDTELIVREDFLSIVQDMEQFDLAMYQKHEITNQIVLKELNGIIPKVLKKVQKNEQNKIPKNIFKIDVPINELQGVKGEIGKYRAIVKGNDGKIVKHAVLTPVKLDIAKSAQAATAIAGVMEVASMVVGQYYMAEISGQLNSINEALNEVKNYHIREFKATIRSLIVAISQLSQFSKEYISNEGLCRVKLVELSNYRSQLTKCLEQVNLSIEEILLKNKFNSFDDYEKCIIRLNNDLFYQKTLLQLLAEVSKLELVFAQGVVSEDGGYYTYNYYLTSCNNQMQKLSTWHKQNIKKFKIDKKHNRRSQEGALKVVADVAKEMDKNAHIVAGVGFIGGVVSAAAGFGVGKAAGELHKAIQYVPVKKNTLKLIKKQEKLNYSPESSLSRNHYGENIELLVEDEKVYYLLPK